MLTPLLWQYGKTPLGMARDNGWKSVEALLRQHGASEGTRRGARR